MSSSSLYPSLSWPSLSRQRVRSTRQQRRTTTAPARPTGHRHGRRQLVSACATPPIPAQAWGIRGATTGGYSVKSCHTRERSNPARRGTALNSLAGSLVTVSTLYSLPFFAMMMVAPHRRWVRSTVESLWFLMPVALIYLVLLAVSWQPDTLSLMMPGSVKEGLATGKPQFFPSLDGISQLFSRSITAASLWVHLVCINLFTARHVFLDGIQHSFPTWHAIFLSTAVGPLALIVHYITKTYYDSVRTR